MAPEQQQDWKERSSGSALEEDVERVDSVVSKDTIDAELRNLRKLVFPCFIDQRLEEKFVILKVLPNCKKACMAIWAINMLALAMSSGIYLLRSGQQWFELHIGMGWQLLLLQLILIVRFAMPSFIHTDTAMVLICSLLWVSVFLVNPWRQGLLLHGDSMQFISGIKWAYEAEVQIVTLGVLSISISQAIRARASRTFAFVFAVPGVYFLSSIFGVFSVFSQGLVIQLSVLVAVCAASAFHSRRFAEIQERQEFLQALHSQALEDKIASLKNKRRRFTPAMTGVTQFDLDVSEALLQLEVSIREEDNQLKEKQSEALREMGWSQDRIKAKIASINRKHSETFGVCVSYILSGLFSALAQSRSGLVDPTFYNLKDSFFCGKNAIGKHTCCPRDGELGCTFLDTLRPAQRGECTHFLSWTWAYSLDTVQSAVKDWMSGANLDPSQVFLWMCFFVNNQYRVLQFGSREFSEDLSGARCDLGNIFEANLVRIGKVVALLDTWKGPVYLTRIWTIYEQFTCIKLGIPVSVIMPPSEAGTLIEEIEKGKGGILYMKEHLSKVNSKMAKATVRADEFKVKSLIRDSVGFDRVDECITDFLVHWMARQVQNYMANLILPTSVDPQMPFESFCQETPTCQTPKSASSFLTTPTPQPTAMLEWTPSSSLTAPTAPSIGSMLKMRSSPMTMRRPNLQLIPPTRSSCPTMRAPSPQASLMIPSSALGMNNRSSTIELNQIMYGNQSLESTPYGLRQSGRTPSPDNELPDDTDLRESSR